MSVSSISSTATAPTHGQHQDPMANVAKLLNMSSSDLRTALQGGASLSDLATKQGVSRDDLLASIEKDLKNRPSHHGGRDAAPDGGGSGTSGTSGTDAPDLAQMAAKIADTKGLPPMGGHRHHHGGGSSSTSSSSISVTTTSASAVSSQVASGSVNVLL